MTESELRTLRDCLASEKPFLAYILPEAADLRFDADPAARIAPWPGTGADGLPPADATPKSAYLANLDNLIAELKISGGKTVIARTIAGDLKQHDLAEIIAGYFPSFPDCLRFIFRMPEQGVWFGATPELLYRCENGRFHTRALAGTRPRGTDGPWSAKNLREHRFVADDIARRLADAGLDASASEPRTIEYGTVEHLATDFSAPAPPCDALPALMAALHPTPAVGGLPRADAMRHIAALELSPRRYYGGTITVGTDDTFIAYVILRCAHTDGRRWAIYTGSGITGDSSPDDEWNETEAKATPLRSLLEK